MTDTQALEDINRLYRRFVRNCPGTSDYTQRLADEIEIILKLRFVDYFLQIRDILDLTKDIPHMTRGSAGSSLVCYLLGITDIDPIEWNIPVARFLNPLRDDLPDVDIDFPHHKQLEVMNRIFAKWPGKTARISNFVMFKEKSARREVAKRLGAVGRLPRNFTYKSLGLDEKEAKRLERKLIGKKKCISKHCGGILVFQRPLPKSLISQENQILLDKYEVEDLEHLKVDILASRGLSQLMEIDPTPAKDYPERDPKTEALLQRGDVLGVTQAESPAMRRLFRAIKPKGRADCVFGTALIRPVAMEGRKKASFFQDWSRERITEAIVCEDDAIEKIAKLIGCDYFEADQYRRAFAKRNEEKVLEFMHRMGRHNNKDAVIQELYGLSGFGLCRAHAVNLGRLIWALAYQKAHNPYAFWKAALKHCQGSYRRWVYRCEAKQVGAYTLPKGKSDVIDDPVWQFKRYGWWSHKEFLPGMGIKELFLDRVQFSGVIANGRVFRGDKGKYTTFLTLGIDNGQYIDVTIPKPVAYSDYDVVHGIGRLKHANGTDYLEGLEWKNYKIDSYYQP